MTAVKKYATTGYFLVPVQRIIAATSEKEAMTKLKKYSLQSVKIRGSHWLKTKSSAKEIAFDQKSI